MNHITVLMTTYNCSAYISRAIKSVLNQTYKDFEFLIIDDGSTDTTSEIVKSFGDERIVYKKIEHLGRSKALNYGLSIAKYDWISIMDADDIAHPLRFEKQIDALSGSENEICFTDAAYFKNNKLLYIIQNNFNENNINEVLALHGHFTNSTFIFNKKHILEFGGYKESLSVFEDYDLWLRIKDKSKFIVVDKVLQFARIRNDSLTSGDLISLNKKFYEIQSPYFKDLNSFFGIYSMDKAIKINGWREYFYGDKKFARYYWKQIKLNSFNFRILIAYAISYLPQSIFDWVKQNKIRLRLDYFLQRVSQFRNLQREFYSLLKEVS